MAPTAGKKKAAKSTKSTKSTKATKSTRSEPKAKAMTKKSLQHFEKRLLEERKRVLKELGHYDETFGSTPQGADGDLSAYSFHMADQGTDAMRSEEHTSELQSRLHLVCRLLLEKKKQD